MIRPTELNFTREPDGVTEATDEQREAAKLLVREYTLEEIAETVGCTVEEIETWILFSPAFRGRVELEEWLLHRETVAQHAALLRETMDALGGEVGHKPMAVAQALRNVRLPDAPPTPRTPDQILDEWARHRLAVVNGDARARLIADTSPLADQVLFEDASEGIMAVCRGEVAGARRRRPRATPEPELAEDWEWANP